MSNVNFYRILRTHLQPAVITLSLLPATMVLGTPTLPTIPAGTYNVTNYGAIGDGSTVDTIAISNAVVAASNAGGGTVEIPAAGGAYLCGPLTLKSSINLQIDSGATLKMLPYGTWPGGTSPPDFITGSSLHDIEISGSGTIDGSATLSGWWNGLSTSERPYMISLSSCQRLLIQNVTLINAPKMHISLKNKGGNITIQGITINTPVSPNTDGIDLVGTNCLVQNCSISDGDDNIAFGTSSANTPTSDTVVTNCAFGIGHGVSIGSNTAGGVSNLTVINCTFSGTDYGIRMKSDDNTSGGSGEGGIAQNLFYYNLGMTNLVHGAIVIYSYYSEYGTPSGITPFIASTQTEDVTTVPVWRNIVISNVTATVASGGIAGIVWGRLELPVTNIVLSHVNITAPKTFDVYNAYGVQFADSQVTVPAGNMALTVFNAGLALTNDLAGIPNVTFDGMTSTNSLALYDASASMTASNVFGANPITLDTSALIISNSLSLPNTTVVNFVLGTNNLNVAHVLTTGSLTLNSTLNVVADIGFGAGTYTLFSYGGGFGGTPVLGTTPAGYNCSLTNPPGLVQLLVQSPAPPSPPSFGSINATASGLVMSGSGGTTNGTFYVLVSTNIALPLNQWTPVATNLFDSSGNFIFTNVPDPNAPQAFYLLQIR
ncbi:MAG TPA: glycosyl hydrolase family 28 protein [Candidatus Limnocylindrales bacterium]|nr:glycosyl hydrolase family 28 protein [Candidatus Limnocylindrales bacterium]